MGLLTRFLNCKSKSQMCLTLRNNDVLLPISTKETDMISEKVMPFVYYTSTGRINKVKKN